MATYYKFLSFGTRWSKRRKYTKDIFANSRLYMGNYKEMNDPMEAIYEADDYIKSYITDIRDAKPNTRMCSLSPVGTNILMWAHYADSNRGICVAVEVTDTNSNRIQVKYGRELQQFKKYTKNIVNQILSYKLSPWKYEQEVRYLRELNIGDKSLQYLGVNIVEVYLGCALSDELVKSYTRKIQSWLKRGNHASVQIRQIKRNELTYWDGQNEIPLIN